MCLSVRWSVHREHSLKMSLKWQRNTENRHHFLCLSAPWGVTHFLFLFLSTRGLRNKLRINKASGIALQRTLTCIFLRKYPSLQLPKAPLHDYRLCLAFGAGQVSPSGFSEPTTAPCCYCEWIKTVKKQKNAKTSYSFKEIQVTILCRFTSRSHFLLITRSHSIIITIIIIVCLITNR